MSQKTSTLVIVGSITLISFYALYSLLTKKRRPSNSAPLVKTWFPLESTIKFGKNPDEYLLENKKKYGPVFAMYLAGNYTVFICDRKNLPAFNSRDLTFEIPMRLSSRLWADISQKTVDLAHEPEFLKDQMKNLHKLLRPQDLEFMVSSASKQLIRVFDGLEREGTRPMFRFVQEVVFEVMISTVFGEKMYSKDLIEHYFGFAGGMTLRVLNIPSLFLPAYVKGKNELVKRFIKSFNENNMEGCMPVMRKRVDDYFREFPMEDAAKSQMVLIVAIYGNTAPTTYWLLYHVLRDPVLFEKVKLELEQNLFYKSQKNWTMQDFEKCVILESCIYEVLRYYTGNMLFRVAERDCELDINGEKVALLAGDRVMTPASIRDTEEEYKWDRFLGKKALDLGLVPFGYGTVMCSGRFFVVNNMKNAIASFIYNLDMELVGTKVPQRDWSGIGQGVLHPLEDCVSLKYKFKHSQ